jgi:hypothetical protein
LVHREEENIILFLVVASGKDWIVMRTRWSALCILAILALPTGCTEKEPTVVIDDWWNVDFAKNGCELRASTGNPCIGDPAADVREFESQLSTFFASDPSCRGVVFVSFSGPKSTTPRVASGAEWQLMLDFVMGESSQSWSMVRRTKFLVTSGQGDPKGIAHAVCTVVKQTGGTVVN